MSDIGLFALGARVLAGQNQAEFTVGLGVRGHIATSTLSRWEHLEAEPLSVLVDLAFVPAMVKLYGEGWRTVIESDSRAKLAMRIRALAAKKGVKDRVRHRMTVEQLETELIRVNKARK